LRNVVERVVLRLDSDIITLDDLPPQFRLPEPTRPAVGQPPATTAVAHALFDRIIDGGECFWSVVHEPFIARDITRHDVRETVRLGLQQTRGSYRILVDLFNMRPDEYKRFLNFLRTFHCHLPFSNFRAAPARVSGENKATLPGSELRDAV